MYTNLKIPTVECLRNGNYHVYRKLFPGEQRSDCENFFPLQDMGPAEKQHLPDLLNFCQTYSLHAIVQPVSQLEGLLNSVSSRIIYSA